MIPVVKRNLPDAEQLLLASAVLVVKAYNAPGDQAEIIAEADKVVTQATWNYYAALVEAHPEIKGTTYCEWRGSQRLHVAPEANDRSTAEAITGVIGQVAEAVRVYMESKKQTIPQTGGEPSESPLNLDTVMKRVQKLDPELFQKIIEFFEKNGFADRKQPDPAHDAAGAAQDDPTPPDSHKVPEGHICEPGKEFCCTECTFGKEPGKCGIPGERAMYVTTDRFAVCTSFKPAPGL